MMKRQLGLATLACGVLASLWGGHAGTASAAASGAPLSVPTAKNAAANAKWGIKPTYYNEDTGDSRDNPTGNGQSGAGQSGGGQSGGGSSGNDSSSSGGGTGATGSTGANGDGIADNGSTGDDDQSSASSDIEKVIADGMKYLGTPYEFGSDRSNSKTFDCSDLMKWIFRETLGITLPADSRQQGDYVKEHGAVQTDWHKLKRGDLMFFMSYEGADKSDYAKVDKSSERITHVGMYLGNGKVLQTYSVKSGGVRVDSIEGTPFEYRFLFGGSVVNASDDSSAAKAKTKAS